MDRIIKIIITNVVTREILLQATRLVTHSLMLSNDIRRNTKTILYFLTEHKKVVFDGKTIRNLRVDEESAFGLVKKFYKHYHTPITREDVENLFEGTCIFWDRNVSEELKSSIICKEKPAKIIIAYPQQEIMEGKCRKKININCAISPLEALIIVNMVIDNCHLKK